MEQGLSHRLPMDRVRILCGMDRRMLYEFSRRSLSGLQHQGILFRTLSFFSSYMDGNVNKEVEKDRLIIEEAAGAYQKGRPLCDLDLEEMFERTKAVDKAFLDRLSVPSFTLSVRYSDFADIRIRRIWRISKTVYALLDKWPEGGGFADAVRSAYRQQEFQAVILEILHLYNLETKTLGEAIRSPFHKMIADYTESLYAAMERAMVELAEGYTKKLFGDEPLYAQN